MMMKDEAEEEVNGGVYWSILYITNGLEYCVCFMIKYNI